MVRMFNTIVSVVVLAFGGYLLVDVMRWSTHANASAFLAAGVTLMIVAFAYLIFDEKR